MKKMKEFLASLSGREITLLIIIAMLLVLLVSSLIGIMILALKAGNNSQSNNSETNNKQTSNVNIPGNVPGYSINPTTQANPQPVSKPVIPRTKVTAQCNASEKVFSNNYLSFCYPSTATVNSPGIITVASAGNVMPPELIIDRVPSHDPLTYLNTITPTNPADSIDLLGSSVAQAYKNDNALTSAILVGNFKGATDYSFTVKDSQIYTFTQGFDNPSNAEREVTVSSFYDSTISDFRSFFLITRVKNTETDRILQSLKFSGN